MTDFRLLKRAVQRQFNTMKVEPIFRAAIDKDTIWNLYLSSFPEGTNPKFRERSEHDCSACRYFIKNAGGMITIQNGQIISLWDIQVEGYQPVVDALAEYVKSLTIENVFLHPEMVLGKDHDVELLETKKLTWEHLCVVVPNALYAPKATIPTKLGEYATTHQMCLRALKEITTDAIETVRDLIVQNSLYRGSEKSRLVNTFSSMKIGFDNTPEKGQDLFVWSQVVGTNGWACRLRGDVIGTLLEDLSEGKDLEQAVKSFEDKVSGTNYKRPTSLITPKMRDAAKQKIEELGLLGSLDRRYAHLEDVSINNVLFANRDAKTRMSGDVFGDLPVSVKEHILDRVEEVSIEKFLTDILPTARSLEVLVENKHSSNLVSLIAPEDLTAKILFKWDNPFSWSYNGDVADSIKERVKSAGGNVTGDICCRLAWYNTDDLDLHMKEPRNHIYYGAKTSATTKGQLDVDMNVGNLVRNPVENIYYGKRSAMLPGIYSLYVNQFARRETTDIGFEVEIDVLGTIHHFSYAKPVTGNVEVAKLKVTESGVEVVPVLPSSQVSKEVWGLQTQQFHPVTALMLSPNYWDGNGVGNKHYFFMLDKCRNDGSARGFYNEFLNSALEPHRKTMEIVGSRMRTDQSEDQLSGLGFSSTLKNTVVVKVGGTFTRTIKVTF